MPRPQRRLSEFHRYGDGEVRTAIAEHLVEAQEYMKNADGTCNLTVTISPEHRELFEEAIGSILPEYEKRYGVKYNITFTYQDKATDTVAVDAENKPFRKADGTLLFRPAGHGALIYNLNKVADELVSIKNIDNVAHEKLLPVTAQYKQVLMGAALQLRDKIFGYDYTDSTSTVCTSEPKTLSNQTNHAATHANATHASPYSNEPQTLPQPSLSCWNKQLAPSPDEYSSQGDTMHRNYTS